MALLPDVLRSEAIELRRWRAQAAEAVLAAELSSLAELHRWMPWALTPPTLKQTRATLAAGDDSFATDAEWPYVVHEATSGEVVGGAGLHRRAGPETLEIGYWIRTDRTGRGYATAAARLLTDAAFRFVPGIERVEIHMDSANLASAAVPPKLGYTLLREEAREIVTPGHSGHGLIWSIDRNRWRF